MRLLNWTIALFWISILQAPAETLVSEAKILEVTERGFVLSIGTEPLAVEDSVATHFWRDCGEAKRQAFLKGDTVRVRIKTDTDPPSLREMADIPSGNWLDKLRKDYVHGTIEKIDAKYLVLKLDDGRTFAYRATDKSAVKIKDKPGASVTTLDKGTQVWAKGRLLSTLDTWLVEITDQQPAVTSKMVKKEKEKKQAPLPESGTLEGVVMGHLAEIKMFDIVCGVRALHITYNSKTVFTLDGRAAKASALARLQNCVIQYRRDKAGRLIASKVELFTPRT